jgi:cell division protein FtsQ
LAEAVLSRGEGGGSGSQPEAAERSRGARRLRRVLLALGVASALLAVGYLLWLRDSSFVRVERTTVTGLTTPRAHEIRTALVDAAGRMTTLHLDPSRLERAVAGYPEVASLELDPAFPHELAVHVVERRPIATVPGRGGDAVAVAADGTLLPAAEPGRPLASLPATAPGSHGSPAPGASGTVEHRRTLTALEVVAAAPPPLVGKIATVRRTAPDGFVVELRDGPPLVFGDGERLESKWIAASSVLSRDGAAGAGYVDVSLPDRPAVGG